MPPSFLICERFKALSPFFEIFGNKINWLAGYLVLYNKQSNTYEYLNHYDHLVDLGDAFGETLNSVTVTVVRGWLFLATYGYHLAILWICLCLGGA